MIKDSSSYQNLGYGVPLQKDLEQGHTGEGSNVIQKALNGHPVMRFFSVAAATAVGFHMAGKIVREGGLRLADKAVDAAAGGSEYWQKNINAYKKIEQHLDDLQGVNRYYEGDEAIANRLSRERRLRGKVTQTDSFNIRAERMDADEDIAPWTYKQEVQRRLVAQARRLPYELPGGYIAQKAVLDPLTGGGQEPKDKVKWSNPVDVLGDFAYQSVKNLAVNILPFDVGLGAGGAAYKGYALKAMKEPAAHMGYMSTRALLEQVGVDGAQLINKTMKYSQSSLGAFSTAIREASAEGRTYGDWVRGQKNAAFTNEIEYQNSNFSRRAFRQAQEITHNRDSRMQAVDALPGPFKGMGAGITAGKARFKQLNKTYDNWQQMMQGNLPLNTLKKRNIGEYNDLRAFMNKGGGTSIEQYGQASFNLGRGGPILPDGSANHDWRTGQFYQAERQTIYKGMLADELSKTTGLKDKANDFVRMANTISPYPGAKAPFPGGENLMERMRFAANSFHGDINKSNNANTQDWWNSVTRSAAKHGINPKEKFSYDLFQQAVKTTDHKFVNQNFKKYMDGSIQERWKVAHGLISTNAGEALQSTKKPYEVFNGVRLDQSKDFLVRKTAERLGIRSLDAAGNPITNQKIKQEIWKRGLNANDLHGLRGYLIDQKQIASRFSINGANVFGFRSMTVQEGLHNNFYAGKSDKVQKEISGFVTQRTMGPQVGRGGDASHFLNANQWDLKINKVYVGPNGQVMDFGRIARGITAGVDKFANSYQIPLIHLKPLQLGGRSSFQSMRNQQSVLYAAGDSIQPISQAAGKGFEPPDFYLWMKGHARKSKGSVYGVRGNLSKGVTSEKYEGLYRPFTTNTRNMLGRYGNNIMGLSDTPSSQTQEKSWKRLFDVHTDQENNLFAGKDSAVARMYRGFKRQPDSMANPVRAAARFGSSTFNPSKITAYESEGLESLSDMLKRGGFSGKALKELNKDPRFSHLFDFKNSAGDSVRDVADANLPEFLRDALGNDRKALKGSAGRQVVKLQQGLKNLISKGEQQVNFWDLPANKTNATGISTRMDELKSELYGYLAARTSVMPGGPTGGFNGTMQSLIDRLEELRRTGAISSMERAEGRAAVLSLQIENARNITHNPGSTNFLVNHSKATLDYLNKHGVETKALFSEVGSNSMMASSGVKGSLKARLSTAFQSTPYEKPFEVNPTGTANTFMPTFGTVWNRNKLGAIKGLGFDTSNAANVSGASIPVTHLVERLNDQFGTFGLKLDSNRYKGPLDLYARGIVGKRVLPMFAVGATALGLDRTAGGMVNKDENGDPVYSPLLLGTAATGIANAQSAFAGLIPGGQTYSEKKAEIFEGEVPIRSGRFWMLGNTPFKGGRIQYFRPSWYQRLKSGANYAPEMNETPLERLAFGYDFSPLRPLDPYRREREDFESRPYPLTGDYFTGPWGPMTTALNQTVGRVLKPRQRMHEEDTAYGLSQYAPVGDSGAYFSQAPIGSGGVAAINAGYQNAAPGTPSSAPFYSGQGMSAPRGAASNEVRNRATALATMYSNAAQTPGKGPTVWDNLVPYGVPYTTGMSPRVIDASPPLDYGSLNVGTRRLGYQTQEMAGIYGFASGAIRSGLGFGTQDFAPNAGVLEPASRGYSASRSFWGLNLGGMGDVSLPMEGKFSNLEASEIVRRFVPKEPAGINYINNIPNLMGKANPWLTGADYPLANLKSGDPYNAITDAEIRLPGTGYNRTHKRYSDLSTAHDILGDVAPWSNEYQQLDKVIDGAGLNGGAAAKVAQTRAQVEAMRYENEFTPYENKYEGLTDSVTHPTSSALGRGMEWLTHRDTYLNTKLGAPRTAVEDWERDNVYGATFPSWNTPYQSFISPMINKSTQRNPLMATLSGGGLGYLFGATAEAKAIGTVVGGALGLGASLYGHAYEAVTGDRFIPLERRKELALEENVDILQYTKSKQLANQASQAGDSATAQFFINQSKQTMYGADLNGTLEQLSMAIPKRKREHFRAMLYAPEQEREQILSTAGRLERRMFQAAWGMDVEKRPDLNEYYQNHELPPSDSDVWRPEVAADTIKIKMGQSMGLDMSQMGYYPQQVNEANLINPSYPSYGPQTQDRGFGGFSMRSRIVKYLRDNNIENSKVRAIPSPYGSDKVQLNAGVYN